MKRILKSLLLIGVFAAAFTLPVLTGDIASAQNPLADACSANAASELCNEGTGSSIESVVKLIVNILLFIVGIISVIMIIIGGIRYSTSAGNASSVTSAKNTILYSIIGLIIAFIAFAVVNWVIDLL